MLRKIFDLILIPVLILALAIDPNFRHGPINFFECGQYLSYVNGLFHGKIPARDFIVLFGPLQVYIIALAMLIFGKTLAVLRTYLYIVYLSGFLAAYFLGRQVCGTRIFAYLIPLLCLWEAAHPYWATRWDFGRAALGMFILLMLVIFSKKEDRKILFVSGLLTGIAIFYSIDIGAISAAAAVVFIASLPKHCHCEERPVPSGVEGSDEAICQSHAVDRSLRRDSRKEHPPRNDVFASLRHTLTYILIYILGIFCIAIPILLFTFFKGGFADYLKTTFVILPSATFKVWGQAVPDLVQKILLLYDHALAMQSDGIKVYTPALVYIFAAVYLAIAAFKKRWDKEKAVILLLFIYGLLIYRMSFRSISGPQFQVALPPLFILLALFIEKGVEDIGEFISGLRAGKARSDKSLLRTMGILCLVSLTVIYLIVSPKRFFRDIPSWVTYQENKAGLVAFPAYGRVLKEQKFAVPEAARVGNIGLPLWQKEMVDGVVRYLEQNTRKDEEIFSFPDKGAYNFFADRMSFSRFYTPGTVASSPEWTRELLKDLETKKPRTVLVGANLSNMATGIDRTKEVAPEILNYINSKYHPVQSYGYMLIYNRNDQ